MALGDGGQTKKKTLPQQERATEEDGGVDGPAGRRLHFNLLGWI